MPKLDVETSRNALVKITDWMIESGRNNVVKYVQTIRGLNPGISDNALAHKIRKRKSFKNGLVGAATGVGGLLTLPVAVPADLVASWKIQIFMAMAIAHVYGHDPHASDLRTDIYLILAGNSAKDALKRVGIEVSKNVTKKAVNKYITREVMKKIWKIFPRKILTKAGQKSLTSFTKMVPLVGAPIGFSFDYFYARNIGKIAIKYYSGRG